MTTDTLLSRLDAVRQTPRGWTAKCPAHDDKSPSLSIAEGADGRILLHDFGGCPPSDIVAALNLELKDLFTDVPTSHRQRPTPDPVKIDRVAVAYRFDLCALDHRLRAERIFSSAAKVTPAQLNDDDLDHALDLIEQGHNDIAQAEFLEGVADDLRMKQFLERDHEQKRRVA